jgi:signal peptidase I
LLPLMRQPRGTTFLVVIATLVVGGFTFALPDYLAINFAYQTVHVIGSAMHPTVDDNDYLVAEKIPYRVHAPRRGDIIIMRDPYDPTRDFIKRVVGLPGERILVRDCTVFIGQRRLIEPYVRDGWTRCATLWPVSGQAANLGPNDFFVMGDNRDSSLDSRSFGPVTRGEIEARVSTRVLPLQRAGPITGPKASLA